MIAKAAFSRSRWTTARRLAPLLLLLAHCAGKAQAEFAMPQGQWYDPLRNGHGIDLQPVGPGHYVLVLYTFDANGEPVWFLANAGVAGDALTGELGSFVYDANSQPPQQLARIAGQFTLREGAQGDCASRPNSAASFEWTIDGESGTWCLKSVLNRNRPARDDFTAMWYTGGQDTGWGLSLGMQGQGPYEVWVVLLFYYDAAGNPRWAQAVGAPADGPMILNNFIGYCRSCDPVEVGVVPAGEISLDLGFERGWPSGTVDMQVAYAIGEGRWDRPQTAITVLTDPLPGLAPLPDSLPASEIVAFLDVDVLDVVDEAAIIPRQTVIVSDGVIEQLGAYRSVPIPAGAWRVYARGQYLGPGLTEMHLHVTVGGLGPARAAGTLLLANGVTGVLNAGDNLAIDMQRLRQDFINGNFLGPTFYFANTAFGPGDNAGAAQTIATPSDAAQYANQLDQLGYDFLKVYWQVPPAAFSQFAAQAAQRAMPLIGHIPQTQSMGTSLSGGQRLAVHVQEPFYSYMQSQIDSALIPGAAQVFLNNGTSMSPTLAVFESYFSVFGGDQTAFAELTARPGVEFTHPNVRQAWVNYFSGPGIQGNGQAIGGLDNLQNFFWRIAREFHQLGVPMLVGTDAPGFPGVMSGYGVHEELRLLKEVGLSDAEAYLAATRNAGRFLDQTIGEVPGIGWIEPGRRADLILLRGDPLSDIDVLRHPDAVVSRGRLYSRDHLDAALDQLAANYQNNKWVAPSSKVMGPAYCADHLHEFFH